MSNEKELNAFKLKFNSFFSGDFQEVIWYLSNIAVEHRDLYQVLKLVNSRIKEHRSTGTSSNATHRQKRSLVYNLQLQQSPLSVDEILAMNPLDPAAPPGSLRNPCVIWCKRDLHFSPPLCTVLATTRCHPHSSDYVCDEAAGVFRLGSADSAVFLAWLKDVVDVPVAERRNVRPVGPDKMVQVGLNAGPHHAQVFRLAKSYTKLLDNITKTEHHSNIIAVTTTVWAAAETWLPTDITHHKLKNIPGPESLPVMWAKVQRAPPEAYLTVDYSASLHVDPCYVLGACAVSVNVNRTIDLPSASLPVDSFPAATPTSNTPSSSLCPSTRSQSGSSPPKVDPATKHPVQIMRSKGWKGIINRRWNSSVMSTWKEYLRGSVTA
ncbi:hypothetical protein B0H16DRAFT_1831397 [Mycena metata]|uniref:Uncharacterized protein n=1 Tax=Mycena metata TaxID=1033252 RepID=A0AAD7DYS7_9AGAR|nr:hypothetical protein B0H16DRAFT_1831397 [Mycena metata]